MTCEYLWPGGTSVCLAIHDGAFLVLRRGVYAWSMPGFWNVIPRVNETLQGRLC